MSSGVGSLCSSIGVDGGTAGGVDNGVRSEDEEKGGGVSGKFTRTDGGIAVFEIIALTVWICGG